ncbi:BspA family leucine-rich repeat surface protein [Vibrio atypicus]|uniref:BspA family leucine-rich repeat surface protein n=1 Tax=Vibrio atypicus TaxID=558271 RepID=UPI0013593DD0|nr:BspA family leucine-rich repeat surface protein [Vibrio atypicus]
MRKNILTLSLLTLFSVNANAAYVALINNSVGVADTSTPPTPACVGPELTRADLDTMIANGDDVTKACTGKITDMAYLFMGYDSFNQDISNWDTSSVKNMEGMFMQPMALPSAFDHDISGWDTSNVENFSYMFLTHVDYKHDLSGWDTSKATNWLDFISLSLSKMDMSDVPSAFHNDKIQAPVDRSQLDSFISNPATKDRELQFMNVSQITNFNSLFNGKTLTADISGWDVSKGTDFSYMFSDTKSFNFDISGWDTSKGTHFIGMFQYNQAFDQDISGWNVSSVSDPSWDARNFRQVAILNYNHIPPSFR